MAVISSKKVEFCVDCILFLISIVFIFNLIICNLFILVCYLNCMADYKRSWPLVRFYFIDSIARSHLRGSMSRSCDIFIICSFSSRAWQIKILIESLSAESCCKLCVAGFKTGGKHKKSQTSTHYFSQDGMQEGELAHRSFRLVFQGLKFRFCPFNFSSTHTDRIMDLGSVYESMKQMACPHMKGVYEHKKKKKAEGRELKIC